MKAVFLRLKNIIHNIVEQYTVIVQYWKNIFVKDMAGSKDFYMEAAKRILCFKSKRFCGLKGVKVQS